MSCLEIRLDLDNMFTTFSESLTVGDLNAGARGSPVVAHSALICSFQEVFFSCSKRVTASRKGS